MLMGGSLASSWGSEPTLSEVFRDNEAVWLQIEVGGEILCPRTRIGSAAYALHPQVVKAEVCIAYNFNPVETRPPSFHPWPEPFSKVPIAFVGDVLGGGGYAEVIITVTAVSTTGFWIYLHNPREVPWSSDFCFNVIGMEPTSP